MYKLTLQIADLPPTSVTFPVTALDRLLEDILFFSITSSGFSIHGGSLPSVC